MLLYTIGDSFTYGEELPDPVVDSWPAVLAQNLNCDLINRSSPGVSNDYMIRTAINDIPSVKPDLVIVAWTACHRQEFADEWSTYHIWPGCSGLGVENHRHKQHGLAARHRRNLIRYITEYNNPEHQYCKWLQNVILLQSYFIANQIPYFFVDAFDFNQTEYKKYHSAAQGYIQQINTKRYIGWNTTSFVNWYYGSPMGPRGHPLEEGHQKIASELYSIVEPQAGLKPATP